MTKNSKCFGNSDGARSGVYKLNTYSGYIKADAWWQYPGQDEFLVPGTYNWICPPGVRFVSAVCVGGGGGGNGSWSNSGGGGAGLGWKNSIAVIPGTTYTVQVGQGGSRNGTDSTKSYFISDSTVAGGAGGNASQGQYADPCSSGRNGNYGGGYTGDGGGRGGNATNYQGGGGAGGYSADGGNQNSNGNQAGGSASGGGYYSSTYGVSAGGGTGIYGRRTDYHPQRRAHGHVNDFTPNDRGIHSYTYGPSSVGGGEGGSTRTGIISGELTGWSGASGENPWGGASNSGTWSANANNIHGGFPGGGGGGSGTSWGGGPGGDGAVRIIWGGEIVHTNRAFPDTNTEDIQ